MPGRTLSSVFHRGSCPRLYNPAQASNRSRTPDRNSLRRGWWIRLALAEIILNDGSRAVDFGAGGTGRKQSAVIETQMIQRQLVEIARRLGQQQVDEFQAVGRDKYLNTA